MERLRRSRDFALWDLPIDDVATISKINPPPDLRSAVRAVFRLNAQNKGKQRHGDKTGRNVLYLDLLGDLLHEARFIHLIRDGRAVAASYTKVSFGPRDVAEAALDWNVPSGRDAVRAVV